MKIKKRWIVLIVIGGLALAVYLLLPHIGTYFQRKYFTSQYQPEPLRAEEVKTAPAEYHISGVPWISYRKAYCQSASLQMISYYLKGERVSLGEINFLMGFTYGAAYISFGGKRAFFLPYTDPEPGFRVAAPYLGLKRRYLVTNDPALFLRGIEYFISSGLPVRVSVNVGRLKGQPGMFSSHSEVIVGYDDKYFYYYETGEKNRFLEEEKGIPVAKDVLKQAVAEALGYFRLPWRYAFVVFEKGEKKENISFILRRNAGLLIGDSFGPVAQGSYAISKFASYLEKLSPKASKWDVILSLVEMLVYTREDDVFFLRGFSSAGIDLKEVVYLLGQAAESYREALDLLKQDKPDVRKAANLIREGAAKEKEAGELLKGTLKK